MINEIGNTITVFGYDTGTGGLRELESRPALPPGFTGRSACADIRVHPSGRFLYGSNRGHDSLALFAVDQVSGGLSFIEHISTGGENPRGFEIEPGGSFLSVANQDSGNIVTFRINADSGGLACTDTVTGLGAPVCLASFSRKTSGGEG